MSYVLYPKLNLTFAAGLLVVLDVLIVDGPLDFFGGRRVDVVFRLPRHFVDETDASRTGQVNDLFDYLKEGALRAPLNSPSCILGSNEQNGVI